jgi:hypothetical protein
MPLIVRNAIMAEVLQVRPSATIWSRLEILPTSADYMEALQAQVADPLWFLTRQWQFNEFHGEDAGSPIEVRLAGDQTSLARFHPNRFGPNPAAATRPYDPKKAPLEVMVEAEPPKRAGAAQSLAAGLHFLRVLTAAGFAQVAAQTSGHANYRLSVDAEIDEQADPKGSAWAALARGRVPDGFKLADAIRAAGGGIPPGLSVPSASNAAVRKACADWLAWFDATLPPGGGECWVPDRLEYAFGTAASTGQSEAVAFVEEYFDGRLDWYDFSLAAGPNLATRQSPPVVRSFNPMLPTPVRFAGMAADRFWEFEDAKVNLAQIQAGPTDLGRLLMIEFALAFGNDWYVIPVDLAIGTLFRVRNLTVRDTFGVTTQVGPTRNADPSRWSMFEISAAARAPADFANYFLLAPTIDGRLEGDPFEEVALFRDEMANMAWAVERKVPGAFGDPVDRYLQVGQQKLSQRLSDLSHVEAEVIYRVSTPVPENWFPFVAIPKQGRPLAEFGIDLERRALLHHIAGGGLRTIHPTGLLLRTAPDQDVAAEPPLRLEDEEVPREGIVLERSHQFARWTNGERLLWVGRSKRVGKGEGASGLRFDILLRKTDLAGT